MKTEKFYLTRTGRPVTFRDQIQGLYSKDGITSIMTTTVTEDTLPLLMQMGVLVTEPTTDSLSIHNVIDRLSKRLGWKPKTVESYLNGVDSIMPMAAFNIIAREIAIMLDEKYPDYIYKSDEIYCISPLDGRIHKLCKAHIKNYKNFAAFRTMEDAKLACSILREPLKEMFKGA